MPPILSSLLNRTRTGLLALLVMVLPLQSVAQLAVGIQAHRHVHTGAAQEAAPGQGSALSMLAAPLRAMLDRLHAAQDPRLGGPKFSWQASNGPAAGLHQHGGVSHRHADDTHDVVDLADPGDEGLQVGATLFLAWLPGAPVLMAGPGGDRPATATCGRRGRVVAPLLAPPRG